MVAAPPYRAKSHNHPAALKVSKARRGSAQFPDTIMCHCQPATPASWYRPASSGAPYLRSGSGEESIDAIDPPAVSGVGARCSGHRFTRPGVVYAPLLGTMARHDAIISSTSHRLTLRMTPPLANHSLD